MNWQKEPMLRTQHLHGSMIQHKGRLIIIGGNGDWQNQDGLVFFVNAVAATIFRQDSIDSVEFLNQNGILAPDNTFGEWTFGTRYPIYVEETSILSTGDFLYVFGKLSLATFLFTKTRRPRLR